MNLLNVLGKGYVIDYCIALLSKEQKEEIYKIYVTNALKVIAENTSRFNGGQVIGKTYYEIINHKEDKRTATEIVEDVTKKAGIKVI